MQRSSRPTFFPMLLLIGMFALGAYLLLRTLQSEPLAVDELARSDGAPPVPSVLNSAEEQAGPAKREPTPRKPEQLTSANLASLLSLDLDATAEEKLQFSELLKGIRSGDRQAGREFARQRELCQDLLFRDVLKRIVAVGSERALWAELDRRAMPVNAMEEISGHLNRQLAELRREMPGCFAFYDEATDPLRDEFEKLAARGNVAARAVYALWPPVKDVGSTTGDAAKFERIRYWELRAMEFTLANLRAGEPLGFKVFIESYRSGELFTAQSSTTAIFFAVASARCGHTMTEDDVRPIWNHLRFGIYDSLPVPLMETFVDGSEEFRTFCESDDWWPRERAFRYLETFQPS